MEKKEPFIPVDALADQSQEHRKSVVVDEQADDFAKEAEDCFAWDLGSFQETSAEVGHSARSVSGVGLQPQKDETRHFSAVVVVAAVASEAGSCWISGRNLSCSISNNDHHQLRHQGACAFC